MRHWLRIKVRAQVFIFCLMRVEVVRLMQSVGSQFAATDALNYYQFGFDACMHLMNAKRRKAPQDYVRVEIE